MLTYKQTRDKQFFEYDKILSYIDIKIWKNGSALFNIFVVCL